MALWDKKVKDEVHWRGRCGRCFPLELKAASRLFMENRLAVYLLVNQSQGPPKSSILFSSSFLLLLFSSPGLQFHGGQPPPCC